MPSACVSHNVVPSDTRPGKRRGAETKEQKEKNGKRLRVHSYSWGCVLMTAKLGVRNT